MPSRQTLLGYWLMACGALFVLGLALGLHLEGQFHPEHGARVALWLLSLAPGGLLLALGMLLEQRLIAPLRHLQIQLARLAANPDAVSDFPPEGWLRTFGTDFDRLRRGWHRDRLLIADARAEGAREAERTRLELEAVLQVLQVPLLLCDRHHRLLLFNAAAETLFTDAPALGLGRRLSELLPVQSLLDALAHLPDDGSPRQILLPYHERWLRCDLHRVGATLGEALITLEDATATQTSDQRWYAPLATLLPALRGRSANLAVNSETLSSAGVDPELRSRLETALCDESRALAELIEQLGHQLEGMQASPAQMEDIWSNDLWSALSERLRPGELELVPIGIPCWLQGDGPVLQELLFRVLQLLQEATGECRFEGEIELGDHRLYLDLIWRGQPLDQGQLADWRQRPLVESSSWPELQDILRRHDSDWWSLAEPDGEHARLRLPLAAADRVGPPPPRHEARPEFHDFGVAELPEPSPELGTRRLDHLELVVFDTETTGLNLRRDDTLISLGACRVLNGRLLARDAFEQLVDPGRPIPEASTRIHGLNDADVAGAPPAEVILPRFREFVGHGVLVAHNAAFDLQALKPHAERAGVTLDMPVLDTLLLSRALDPTLEGHGLDALAERFDLHFPPGTRHTALGDARVTAELLLMQLPRLEAHGVITLEQAIEFQNRGLPRSAAQ